MRSVVSVERISELRKIYTPGVATTCLEIQRCPEKAYSYTSLGHTVGIVTNGTAILGLGNIGVHAGLPVMEGKAVLLDRLVGHTQSHCVGGSNSEGDPRESCLPSRARSGSCPWRRRSVAPPSPESGRSTASFTQYWFKIVTLPKVSSP